MDFPEEVVAATEAAESFLLAQPGVTAVGLGMREQDGEFFDELSVRVYLADIGQIPVGLPEQIGGVGVCFVAGDIRPCGGPDVNRFVGLSGGIQITSVKGAGTLGAIVEVIASGTPLGLGPPDRPTGWPRYQPGEHHRHRQRLRQEPPGSGSAAAVHRICLRGIASHSGVFLIKFSAERSQHEHPTKWRLGNAKE